MDLKEDLTCIICLNIFNNPCSLPCGHCFCQTCIMEQIRYKAKCPMCKTPTFNHKLPINIALKNVVEKYKEGLAKDPDFEIEDDTDEFTFDDSHIEEYKNNFLDKENDLEDTRNNLEGENEDDEIKETKEDNKNKEEIELERNQFQSDKALFEKGYKKTLVFRSTSDELKHLPEGTYKLNIFWPDFKESFEFFAKQKYFVLIPKSGIKYISENQEPNKNFSESDQLIQLFSYISLDKINEETLEITAKSEYIVDCIKVIKNSFNVTALSIQSDSSGILRKIKNYKTINANENNNKSEDEKNKILFSIPYSTAFFKRTDFIFHPDLLNMETESGKKLYMVYREMCRRLRNFKSIRFGTFSRTQEKFNFQFGNDNLLSKRFLIENAEKLGLNAGKVLLEPEESEGLKINIFENPHQFLYLILRLVILPQKDLDYIRKLRNLETIVDFAFDFFSACDPNLYPTFVFRLEEYSPPVSSYKIFGGKGWMVFFILVGFFIIAKMFQPDPTMRRVRRIH